MARTVATRTRELWNKIQYRIKTCNNGRTLCTEWLDFNKFVSDLHDIEGSEVFFSNGRCNFVLKYGTEYNKDACIFKVINGPHQRQESYIPTEYEYNYLNKCISNEIDKYPEFYYLRDELKSIGNYALGKACCSFKEGEFKYYALKCIQNELHSYIKNNTKKSRRTISVDKEYDTGDDATPLLDILCNEDTFQGVNTQLALDDAISTLDEVDKIIITMYSEGYLQREIGQVCGLSDSYTGRKIKKIVSKLEEIIYSE